MWVGSAADGDSGGGGTRREIEGLCCSCGDAWVGSAVDHAASAVWPVLLASVLDGEGAAGCHTALAGVGRDQVVSPGVEALSWLCPKARTWSVTCAEWCLLGHATAVGHQRLDSQRTRCSCKPAGDGHPGQLPGLGGSGVRKPRNGVPWGTRLRTCLPQPPKPSPSPPPPHRDHSHPHHSASVIMIAHPEPELNA